MFCARRTLLVLVAVVLAACCTAVAGCHSVLDGKVSTDPPSPAAIKPADGLGVRQASVSPQDHPAAVVIGPRHRVEWSIEAAEGLPQGKMTGREVVGPDGALPLGPYGTVEVAGMSPNQAAAAIQARVRAYVNAPKVHVRVLPPEVVVPATHAVPLVPAPARPVVEWSSGAPESKVVGTGWTSTPRGEEVRLVSSEPGISLSLDEPPGPMKDLPGKEGKDGPVQDKEKIKAPKDKDKTADPPADPVYLDLPLHHIDLSCPPNEAHMVPLPPYRIGPPDILQIDSLRGVPTQEVRGPHLVRPDGTVGVGTYGQAYVAGLTIEEAKDAIAQIIFARLNQDEKSKSAKITLKNVREGMSVDVIAYNSKVFYVITDGAGNGQQVTRLPITGNDKVLDALSQNFVRPGISGLSPVSSKKHIWVARPCPDGREVVLPVDWNAITQKGSMATNYQLLPGDRVYVKADMLRTVNTIVDKFLSPAERILGVTLLGSQTVNSIKTGVIP
jgi:protein involved in polysaccharide export with SLBB domain